MDINERPEFTMDYGFSNFVLACIDNARYEGFIDTNVHDFVTAQFKLLVHDFIADELFINELQRKDPSLNIERSKVVWL